MEKFLLLLNQKLVSVVSDTEKDRIVRDLRSFIVGSITPVIRDPKKYSIKVRPQLTYNKNKTRKSPTHSKNLLEILS